MIRLPLAAVGAAALLCGSLSFAGPVQAESISLPHTTLEVAVPEGYCALDSSDPIEAEVMRMVDAMQEGQNAILFQFVECDELGLWRGSVIDEFTQFGQVMLPLSNGQIQPIPFDRATFLKEMKNYLPTADDGMLEELQRAVEDNDFGMTIEELEFLGILAEDSNGLYVGLIGRPSLDGDVGDLQAGLMSMTLVRNTVVSSYLYRPYEGDGDFEQLIGEAQAYLAGLVAANP